jgi:NTE family protein
LFNSAFIDALEGDLEHLERINQLVELIPEDVLKRNDLPLRRVETRVISPTRPVDTIAGRKIRYLPKSLRFFLRAIGATTKGGGATAASYLLFDQSFIGELIELGYQDTMWESENLREFFKQE